jgi:hypothetical protein
MSQPNHLKYQVEQPRKLSSWTAIAKWEITKWLCDAEFKERITREVMSMEDMGPFTKFLYYFAFECQTGWGVMVDFNEYRQRVFLTDHYYKWMHQLRDEVIARHNERETIRDSVNGNKN